MWEYKVVLIKEAYDNLDAQMNTFGIEGWEIFKIDELLRTNETTESGVFLFTFRLYMKKKI